MIHISAQNRRIAGNIEPFQEVIFANETRKTFFDLMVMPESSFFPCGVNKTSSTADASWKMTSLSFIWANCYSLWRFRTGMSSLNVHIAPCGAWEGVIHKLLIPQHTQTTYVQCKRSERIMGMCTWREARGMLGSNAASCPRCREREWACEEVLTSWL